MKETTADIQNKIDKAGSIDDLHEILKNLPCESFCVRVDEMRQAHNKKFSEIEKQVAISKTQYHNVLNGTVKPQRHHIIKIGIAMELSVPEINELLKLAHHKELYAKKTEDAIIIYGIQRGMSVIEIQELLDEKNASFSLIEK